MKCNTHSTLLFFIILGLSEEVQGFTTGRAFVPISKQRANRNIKILEQGSQARRTRSTKRDMITPLMDISVVSNSNVEVEVFADLSHILLDFGTMFSPNTLLLKLFVLCGRVFSILSDLTPDGSITTDEFLFQSCMLALSSYNVINMIMPLIRSTSQTTSFQDRRIYQSIFRPIGFTWSQFKFLIANGSFEWVDISPKSTLIETKENLLITYRGTISRKSPRKQDSQVYGQRIGRCSHDFIGDLTSTKEIVDSYGTNYKQNLILQEDADPQILTTDNDRVLLLRINTERILQSAQKDPLIDYATKNLFFHAVLSLCEPAALESSDSSEIVNGTDDSTYYSCTV
jgi:hypothetical protein